MRVLQLRSQLWKNFCQDIRGWIKFFLSFPGSPAQGSGELERNPDILVHQMKIWILSVPPLFYFFSRWLLGWLVFKLNHSLMGLFQQGHMLAENPSAFADRPSKISVGRANPFLRRAYLLIGELFILQGAVQVLTCVPETAFLLLCILPKALEASRRGNPLPVTANTQWHCV